jgi:hypothetical protein
VWCALQEERGTEEDSSLGLCSSSQYPTTTHHHHHPSHYSRQNLATNASLLSQTNKQTNKQTTLHVLLLHEKNKATLYQCMKATQKRKLFSFLEEDESPEELPILKKSNLTNPLEASEGFNENEKSTKATPSQTNRKRRKRTVVYPFGNYDFYYKYRTQSDIDPRIEVMKSEWFEDKRCLDIGCNSGKFTLDLSTYTQA